MVWSFGHSRKKFEKIRLQEFVGLLIPNTVQVFLGVVQLSEKNLWEFGLAFFFKLLQLCSVVAENTFRPACLASQFAFFFNSVELNPRNSTGAFKKQKR